MFIQGNTGLFPSIFMPFNWFSSHFFFFNLCEFLLSWWLFLSLSFSTLIPFLLPRFLWWLVAKHCWVKNMRNMPRKVGGVKKDFKKVVTVWLPCSPMVMSYHCPDTPCIHWWKAIAFTIIKCRRVFKPE